MSTEIYVGNLGLRASERELHQLFAPYGEVHSAILLSERGTGRKRGLGFVQMAHPDADKAIAALNGRRIDGLKLRVSEAKAANGPSSSKSRS